MIKKDPLVAIVILNYKGLSDTIECVRSLSKITYSNYQVVIIDNNSRDGSYEYLCKNYPDHKIFQTSKNLGYAGGNNVGIKYALECDADYICILNNDVLVDPTFLKQMVDLMESNQMFGIVGPRICEYFDNEIIQSTGASINLYKGKVIPLNSGKKESQVNGEALFCDFIGGACMLVKKEVIQKIGVLPEDYFLFYEETDWCLKAKKIGYQVVCDYRSKIIHKGSASINKVSGLSNYFMCRNRVIFEKKNANNVQLAIFSMYLILEILWNVIVRKEDMRIAKFYVDGVSNKIDKKYCISLDI